MLRKRQYHVRQKSPPKTVRKITVLYSVRSRNILSRVKSYIHCKIIQMFSCGRFSSAFVLHTHTIKPGAGQFPQNVFCLKTSKQIVALKIILSTLYVNS